MWVSQRFCIKTSLGNRGHYKFACTYKSRGAACLPKSCNHPFRRARQRQRPAPVKLRLSGVDDQERYLATVVETVL
jgi:hypothetical protein